MRSLAEFNTVVVLLACGYNDCQVARFTGIPRETVRDRRHGRRARERASCATGDACEQHDFAHLPHREYAYLFGLYLGEGYIAKHPRAWKLRITMDVLYPAVSVPRPSNRHIAVYRKAAVAMLDAFIGPKTQR